MIKGDPQSERTTVALTGPSYGVAMTMVDLTESRIQEYLGCLAESDAASGFDELKHKQLMAWRAEFEILLGAKESILRHQPDATEWALIFEFNIPRRGKRIDLVVLTNNVILVIEFKIGANRFDKSSKEQVEDYALELADFHSGSHSRAIIPLLIATEAQGSSCNRGEPDSVFPVSCCGSATFAEILVELSMVGDTRKSIVAIDWINSRYLPTPTIIEAAQRLYATHDVRDITRNDASLNLNKTQDAIKKVVSAAANSRGKWICFVTGVPGAGKTLAGLNSVCDPSVGSDSAAFLSGNGPLVKVLVEALARSDQQHFGGTIKRARQKSSTFIQNVHTFIRHYLDKPDETPDCHVVVFDEAQRAWSYEHSFKKFKRSESEPASMLRILDRHEDWAVVICLIGGGQEIHSGEAGLREWGRAIEQHFSHWNVAVSPHLLCGTGGAVGQAVFDQTPERIHIDEIEHLHLDVPTRTYRSPMIADWVAHLLDGNPESAKRTMDTIKQYPIVMTRSLEAAREWLGNKRRGMRQAGLVASSGARRLRPYGIDVQAQIDEAHWFLKGTMDVRSSSFMEIVATEFSIQGLEVDWAGVCWGADLRFDGENWTYHRFKGSKWQQVRQEIDRQYMLNKYRVLLTRAREGVIIWLPEGSHRDTTRQPQFYDRTADYLTACGVPLI